MPARSPLDSILERQPFAVLDGGLATELERRGADLRDPLWSARILVEQPTVVRQVHLDYLRAGADVVVTASYQATFRGFAARGFSAAQAEAILLRSVELAGEARDELLAGSAAPDRPKPLVAASIGPYGAYLHDGSEYRGEYGRTSRELADFHRDRFEVLAGSQADLLAFETIPSRREADVLAELLERRGGRYAWLSFTARDQRHIADGTPFADCVRALAGSSWLCAVGINCTPPSLIAPLLESAGPVARAPFVVYPNSGESYDAPSGTWRGRPESGTLATNVERWHELGARLIGGCCRTGPREIAEIRGQVAA